MAANWKTLLATLTVAWMLWLASPGVAQEANDLAAEEARQKQIVERFLGVLEKNPRRGTALDRVYGYHVEYGTLDAFVKGLRERTTQDVKDGTAWMLLGLIEAQRGEDAAAVGAFKNAETHLPQNALAPYYLGQSLVLVGRPDQAVEAYERAISRKPAPPDLLEIFQQLGRVHQRAQRTDKALEAWSRLEKLFPNDARVQEQIAVTLVEEGQPALALPRYESLVKMTRDDYRKTVYRIEAAEIKVKLGKSKDGLADLETLLDSLNPDSWLHREVRRRIEDVFLRTDDQDGLVTYYEQWIAKHQEDVDSMARLARVLARGARVPEATQWLDKALKLAPSRKELRLAFIEQLVDDQRLAEAAKQFEALDKTDPNNPDYVREWGKLILKDKTQTIDARKKAAEKVWRKLVIAKPKDPLLATQVADLFRHAELQDQALELYRKAAELSPEDPQYREYLGEYLHVLKRPQEALAVWKEIAAGKRRTAENVSRLAEVYNGFGYTKEAVVEIAAACKLDPKDFSLQLKASEYHSRAEKYTEALQFVAAAEKLAASDDEREEVLLQRIKVYQANGTLDEQIETLAASLKDKPDPKGTNWFVLARYHEAERQYPEASKAIAKSLEIDPQSVPALATAARIEEQGGNLLAASQLNRKLSLADRRSRSDYLTNVARLESQLGRVNEALQAGRDLIAAAPGNTENYEFFAQLCFKLGRGDEGLDTLRRAVRINPTEPKLGLTLAQALAEQLRTDEAIQVYWQAFEKLTELEDKITVVTKLTELYAQLNQFDKLVERLERDRREAEKRREMTICLAQAHHSSGDYGSARQELEGLLSENTRDTQLLQQLSKLAEEEQDLASAVKYQEHLAKLAPGAETEYRLATLLQKSGSQEEATAILVRITQREEDPERVLRSLDTLFTAGSFDTVLAITEPLLREQPRNWEVLYREGAALGSQGKTAEATLRFQRLLDLATPLTELSTPAAKLRKQALAKEKSNNLMGRTTTWIEPTPYSHLSNLNQIRAFVGLGDDGGYGRSQWAPWTPLTYATARTAALGWLLGFSEKAKQVDEFVAAKKKAADAPNAGERALFDYLVLQSFRNEGQEVFRMSRQLAKSGDLASQRQFLQAVSSRMATVENPYVSQDPGDPAADTTPPLPPEDISLMLECFRSINRPGNRNSGFGGGTAAYVVRFVARELRRAKRNAEADQLIKEALQSATDPDQLLAAMALVVEKGDLGDIEPLFDRWAKTWMATRKPRRGFNSHYESPSDYLLQLIAVRGADKAYADVLRIYDRYLRFAVSEVASRRSQTTRHPPATSRIGAWGMRYYVGKQTRHTTIDYPSPNEYFDNNALMILRGVFEIYREQDIVSDLIPELRKRLEAKDSPDPFFERLALGYVLWWSEDREAALVELETASNLVPQDLGLKLELAQLQEAQGNLDEALVMVDAITPLEQATLQRRETMALQLAERLGDVDRARLAAERLFGLRLDSDTQLVLASRMRRLGMDQLAQAVTARAQRQTGNRTSSMLTLMTHYQGLGQTDVAVQLAHKILQRSRSRWVMNSSNYNAADGNRRQALELLAQTGTLAEMITRLESQVKQSPESTTLYMTLSEYYEAQGDREKGLEAIGRILAAKPDDHALRFQYAKRLESAGKPSEACTEYLVVLKKRPDIASHALYELRNTFQRANRSEDLAAALDQMDLKAFRYPWYVMNIAQTLVQQTESRDAGIKLYKKAFEAYPTYRRYLINNLYDEELWTIPEVFELGKKSLLPSPALGQVSAWHGLNEIYSYSGDGKINSAASKVLDAATRQNKFDELRTELRQAVEKYPNWTAGKVFLALVDVRQGQKDAAKAALLKIVKDEATLKTMNSTVRWLVGQELENFGDLQDVVIQLYEGAFETTDRNQNDFQYTPGMRLVQMYAAAGRKEDARKLLLKAYEKKNEDQYNREYNAYRKVRGGLTIAEQLQKLDYAVDALRIYRSVLSDPAAVEMASRYWGETPDAMLKQTRAKLTSLLQSMGSEKAGEVMLELLKPAARPAVAGSEQPPAVDLMLTAPARELDKSQMQSAFAALIAEVGKNASTDEALHKAVTALAQEHPDDLSAQITAVMVLLPGGDAAKIDPALESLAKRVESLPLEDLPAGKRPNSRQRSDAMRQVPLWLVARGLLADANRRELGAKLGERALAAAKRQVDTIFAVSILHEWGQISLDAGDRKGAEDRWGQLLELVTARPRSDKKPRPAGDAAPMPAVRPTSRATPRPAASSGIALITDSHQSSPPPYEGGGRGGVTAATDRLQSADPMAPQRALLDSGSLSPPLTPPYPPLRKEGETRLQASSVALAALLITSFQDATSAKPTATAKPPADRAPPITVSQFQWAMQLAKLAAQKDMPQLSLRAVRQALSGGAPLPDLQQTDDSRGRMSGMRSASVSSPSLESGDNTETMGTVATSLRDLSRVWEAKQFPPQEIFALLAPIVFPAERPGEILLYPEGVIPGQGPQESLGATLIVWARRAGKAGELRKAVAERMASPTAKLPGQVLLVQLALAERDAPGAKAGLQRIAESLKTEQLPASVNLACHAALPAFDDSSLAEAAFPVVEAAARSFAAQNRDDVGELIRRMTRHLGRKGDAEGVRKQLEAFLVSRQRRYADYGGDYALYLQRQDMATSALEAARTGLPDVALDYLGRYSDTPIYRYSEVAIEQQMYRVTRELLNKPAAERYALLRTWTLPADRRKTVRLVSAWTVPIEAPAAFLKPADRRQPGDATGGAAAGDSSIASREYLSNFDLLLDAAQEAGKLDELAAEVNQAATNKIPQANWLLALLHIRRNDETAARIVIQDLVNTFDERNKDDARSERGVSLWGDYLTCRAALVLPGLSDISVPYAVKVRGRTQSRQQWAFMTYLRQDVARHHIGTLKDAMLQPGDDPGLKLWFPATPFGHTLHNARPWWVVHQGQVAHVAGRGHDMLYFRWPLTGDFEFSVDGYNGGWGEGDIGYGGIVVEAQHRGAATSIWPVGQHEQISRGEPMEREDAGFNRITLRVSQGKLQYLLNNYLVYEEPASPTSPWLHLYGHFPRMTSFKNFRLTGNPVIPREVRLTEGNHLEGWMCAFLSEHQPSRRLLAERPTSDDPYDYSNVRRSREPSVYEWDAKDGEIVGSIVPAAGANSQSWLSYHRPLQNGDKVRYEFRYEPGRVHVHPAIGRLAFLLEPAGVRLHWITRAAWDEDALEIDPRNAVDDASCRRGPQELPLKAGEWNSVEVSLAGGMATISLNGTPVCERPIEPENERQFGLFRYRRDTEARVRNVVLTGDWPESIPQDDLQNLIALKSDPPVAERLARSQTIDEAIFLEDVYDVWSSSQKMPAGERYEFLRRWVLPGDDHLTYRLNAVRLPEDHPDNKPPHDGLVAPVFALLETAVELGKLDGLAKSIGAVTPNDSPVVKRNKLSLQSLLAMTAGDLPMAEQRLRELYVLIKPLLPADDPLHTRFPEYVAVWRAGDHPQLSQPALQIAALLLDKQQAKSAGADWERLVRELRGRARWKLDPRTSAVAYSSRTEGLSQWIVAPFSTIRQHAGGHRPAQWNLETRGIAEELPGQASTRLIYRSPLTGDYEITGERSTFGWRETFVAVGGVAVDPLHDLKGYWVQRQQRDRQRFTQPLTIPHWGHFMDFRVRVQGGVMTADVNGKTVHVETLPAKADPWLVIEPTQPGATGCVRNLRITGSPAIPESVTLSEIDRLSGWRAEFYGDSIGTEENSHWKQQGEEIIGSIRKDRIGQHRESLLLFQRPLDEDGELQYEFLYVPGSLEVHPCLGRDCVIMRPDGLQRHTLTAAQYELSGLKPDNLSEIPDSAAKLPLKEKEWNAVRLTLQGDVVTIFVNGTEVGEIKSPPNFRRQFGLFRYSDLTGCRVRKLVYRGNWPKTLPPVEEQDLAYPAGGPIYLDALKLPVQVSVALNQPNEMLVKQGFKFLGPARHRRTETNGLHLSLAAGEMGRGNTTGLQFTKPIKGDFEITLGFKDLKLVAPKEGQGTGLDFVLALADPAQTRAGLERRILKEGRQVLHSVGSSNMPDAERKHTVWTKDLDLNAGSLRLVRRGSRLHCLYAQGDTNDFQLLATQEIGTADVMQTDLAPRSSDAVSGVDIVLTEFTLKAEGP